MIQFIPGILSVIMSFTNLDVQYIRRPFDASFVELQNYFQIFKPGTASGNGFIPALLVTLRFTFTATTVGYCLGLGAALLLNQNFPGRNIIRALMIVPWMVPSIVSAFIWRMMFLRDYGIVNKVLMAIGLAAENKFWLLGDRALFVLIIARLWSSFPFVMISVLAALQTIPGDFYEAAKIDGANIWQRFFHITLPGIAPVSKVIVILQFIWASGEFTLPFAIFLQSPPREANLISVLIYQNSFKLWDFGKGAAMSTVMLVVMMILAVIYMRVVMKTNN
jgi:multiple sugar transport system permease protein